MRNENSVGIGNQESTWSKHADIKNLYLITQPFALMIICTGFSTEFFASGSKQY